MKSPDFLDAVKERHNIPSDRKLAHFLGSNSGRISLIRTGTRKIDDGMAIKIADALEVPHLYVLASIQAERAKRSDISGTWRAIAESVVDAGKGAAAALVLALVFGVAAIPQTAHSAELVNDNDAGIYIMRIWLRLRRRLAQALSGRQRRRYAANVSSSDQRRCQFSALPA